MRIVGGAFRGRGLISPDGMKTRPTSDRARQAIFNILEHASWAGPDVLDGAQVLDAFAGTGALGLEALSRGAADAVFIEKDTQAIKVCAENIRVLGLEDRATILRFDATNPGVCAPRAQRTLVFLDPPYDKGLGQSCLKSLVIQGWLAPKAICIFETSSKLPESIPEGFIVLDQRDYGAAKVYFLSAG
jgi:16S rRNA (guanine966-N2)-methyltransferase